MPYERPRRTQRQAVVVVLGEDVVERADQVGGAVDQRPVEIEGDDGAGKIVFGRGQGRLQSIGRAVSAKPGAMTSTRFRLEAP